MDYDQKTPNVPIYWQEEYDRLTLFCLANFQPGRALERWWNHGTVTENDSRSYYRHSFGSRYEYDGRLPVPSDKMNQARRVMFRDIRARGVYINLLDWRGYRALRQKVDILERYGYLRPGLLIGASYRHVFH
ncbi:MAG TPA: hypothetical protein VFI27_06180 [candidate division Zixibacteria bacterium]|nr:hypothetical protein [candidate division Zixibacteria bacterium]